MNIESIKILRDKADNNIKEYCAANNESYKEVRSYLMKEADKENLLLPIDFYIKYYNLTIEFLNE